MTSQQHARQHIDQQPAQSGWMAQETDESTNHYDDQFSIVSCNAPPNDNYN